MKIVKTIRGNTNPFDIWWFLTACVFLELINKFWSVTISFFCENKFLFFWVIQVGLKKIKDLGSFRKEFIFKFQGFINKRQWRKKIRYYVLLRFLNISDLVFRSCSGNQMNFFISSLYLPFVDQIILSLELMDRKRSQTTFLPSKK